MLLDDWMVTGPRKATTGVMARLAGRGDRAPIDVDARERRRTEALDEPLLGREHRGRLRTVAEVRGARMDARRARDLACRLCSAVEGVDAAPEVDEAHEHRDEDEERERELDQRLAVLPALL
jgi:hypothetical protein